jgi:hypothetical protein
MAHGIEMADIHTRFCGAVLEVIHLNRVERDLLSEELALTVKEDSGLFIQLGSIIEPIRCSLEWPAWTENGYRTFLTKLSQEEREFISYGYIEISGLRWYAPVTDKFVATRFMCAGSEHPWRILDETILEPPSNTVDPAKQADGNTKAEK